MQIIVLLLNKPWGSAGSVVPTRLGMGLPVVPCPNWATLCTGDTLSRQRGWGSHRMETAFGMVLRGHGRDKAQCLGSGMSVAGVRSLLQWGLGNVPSASCSRPAASPALK